LTRIFGTITHNFGTMTFIFGTMTHHSSFKFRA
jgi:hypothetical protein